MRLNCKSGSIQSFQKVPYRLKNAVNTGKKRSEPLIQAMKLLCEIMWYLWFLQDRTKIGHKCTKNDINAENLVNFLFYLFHFMQESVHRFLRS